VASLDALTNLWEAVETGASGFSVKPDSKIAFHAPQGFRVRVDMVLIGDGCVEQIYETAPFYEGAVASMSDLVGIKSRNSRGPWGRWGRR